MNTNHYMIKILKIVYIENQTGGNAAQYLALYLREGAANKFITANKIFKYLENIYLDPN